jgi:hypothetical protein
VAEQLGRKRLDIAEPLVAGLDRLAELGLHQTHEETQQDVIFGLKRQPTPPLQKQKGLA